MIVNAVGMDRPGIVSDVTKYVTDSGGNVGQSQAAKLGDYFSIMMQIQVPSQELQQLKENLMNMPDMNASIFEIQGSAPSSSTARVACKYKNNNVMLYVSLLLSHPPIHILTVDTGKFELEGASYPGIVHKVTSLLAKHGLSIDTMGTTEEIAPHGGTHLFRMKGIAHAFEPLPKTFDANQIRDELLEMGNDLNCDLSLEDVKDSFSGTFYGT